MTASLCGPAQARSPPGVEPVGFSVFSGSPRPLLALWGVGGHATDRQQSEQALPSARRLAAETKAARRSCGLMRATAGAKGRPAGQPRRAWIPRGVIRAAGAGPAAASPRPSASPAFHARQRHRRTASQARGYPSPRRNGGGPSARLRWTRTQLEMPTGGAVAAHKVLKFPAEPESRPGARSMRAPDRQAHRPACGRVAGLDRKESPERLSTARHQWRRFAATAGSAGAMSSRPRSGGSPWARCHQLRQRLRRPAARRGAMTPPVPKVYRRKPHAGATGSASAST